MEARKAGLGIHFREIRISVNRDNCIRVRLLGDGDNPIKELAPL